MSIQFPNLYRVDVNQGPLIVWLPRLFQGDASANRIGCYLYNGDTEITPGGTVAGEVLLSDGTVVALEGAVSGNLIYVDLTDACYAAHGAITVSVSWTNGTATVTPLQGHGVVNFTQTGETAGDVPASVAQLIYAINTAVASIPSDYTSLLAAIAPDFSTGTSYTAGQYVWYSGTLYKFTAAHHYGSWTGTDAVVTVICNDLAGKAEKTMLAPVEGTSTASAAHIVGTPSEYFIYGGVLYQATEYIAQGDSIVTTGTWQNCEAVTVCGEISAVKGDMGALAGLHTEDKTSLVNAINEVHDQFPDGVEAAVSDWLDDHPEATTTVEDGSLTYNKLVIGTLGFVTPEMYGATGNASEDEDDTSAFVQACQSGLPVYLAGTYNVIVKNQTVLRLSNLDRFEIFGNGKIVNISDTVPTTDIQLILFENCKNIKIRMAYEGCSLFDVSVGPQQSRGEAVFRFRGCENIDVNLNVKNARYGIVCGDYNNADNYCNIVRAKGRIYNTAYFAALYGAENIEIDCTCQRIRRSVYLAGCTNFIVNNTYNDAWGADTNVLLTNEYRNHVMCGCSNGIVRVSEAEGASHNVQESKNAGISIADANRTSDLDAALTFENITFDLDVKSKSCGFGVVSDVNSHTLTINDVTVKISTPGQDSFTAIRNEATMPFTGKIVIRDSDLRGHGVMLLAGLYELDNSKVFASSGEVKANMILKNGSFASGRFDAMIDDTSGCGFDASLNGTNVVYYKGKKLSSSGYVNTTNYSANVSGGQIIMLSDYAVVQFTDRDSLDVSYIGGNVIVVPEGNYTMALTNGVKMGVGINDYI